MFHILPSLGGNRTERTNYLLIDPFENSIGWWYVKFTRWSSCRLPTRDRGWRCRSLTRRRFDWGGLCVKSTFSDNYNIVDNWGRINKILLLQVPVPHIEARFSWCSEWPCTNKLAPLERTRMSAWLRLWSLKIITKVFNRCRLQGIIKYNYLH